MTYMIGLLTACLFYTALTYAQPVDLMVRAEPTEDSKFRNTVILFACAGSGGFLANVALFVTVHMYCSKAPSTEEKSTIGDSKTPSISSQSNNPLNAQGMAEKAGEFIKESMVKAEKILKDVQDYSEQGCVYVIVDLVDNGQKELDLIKPKIGELKLLINVCSQAENDAKEAAGPLGESDPTIRNYLFYCQSCLRRLNNIANELNRLQIVLEDKISQHLSQNA